MNELNVTKVITMTSPEIAELTGKRLDNVNRDIEKMFAELEIDLLKFEGNYRDPLNRKRKNYE